MSAIKCCRYCVPPKRHPGCHSKCPDYLKERAEYDQKKAMIDAKRKEDFVMSKSDYIATLQASKMRKK